MFTSTSLLSSSALAVLLVTSLPLVATALRTSSSSSAELTVTLSNAADAGVQMPIVGMGTGGYSGSGPQNSFGTYPECFDACFDATCMLPIPDNFTGTCGLYVDAAITIWLQLGGKRIDSSASYHNQLYVGRALTSFLNTTTNNSTSSNYFVTSKVGPFLAMGYNETMQQYASMLTTMNRQPDLILIHWPSCSTGGGCTIPQSVSADPPCIWGAASYNEAACRLSTWKALVDIWQAKGTRAIGVSNFNTTHLEEIKAAGMPLPAVNQIPFHLYAAAKQMDLLAYCKSNNIVFNGYSPFGVPDRAQFSPPMSATELIDPVVVEIAQAHGRTPGEILLAWQWAQGVIVNPRSQNVMHMMANLNFADIVLTAAEMEALNSRPQE